MQLSPSLYVLRLTLYRVGRHNFTASRRYELQVGILVYWEKASIVILI